METKIVNSLFLSELFAQVGGRADDEYEVEKYLSIDHNNKEMMSKLLKDMVVEYITAQPQLIQNRMKYTLQYYLCSDEIDFNMILSSCLLPFAIPDNPKNIFVWIWELWQNKSPCEAFDKYQYTVIIDDRKLYEDYQMTRSKAYNW